MYRDNTLIPAEAVRLAALGSLAEGGKGYGDLKGEVAEIIVEALRPIRRRYHELSKDPATIDDVLRAGAEEARRRSAPTLQAVKERVGFILPNS